MKIFRLIPALFLLVLVSACADFAGTNLPTPLSAEFLPTAIALTVEAGQPVETAPIATPSPQGEDSEAETGKQTASISPTPSVSPTEPVAEIILPVSTPTPAITPTPASDFPSDSIEIYQPGDFSRVISPLHLYAYLRPGAGDRVRIELFGEDGRLLVRQVKVYEFAAGVWANLSLDIDFEITATAEVGRLVISVEDASGRLVAVNSVDMVLLSLGETDLNPSDNLLKRIVIQEPQPKALIQGETLLVSGQARLEEGETLIAQLIDEEGRIVGIRVFAVSQNEEEPYGTFSAEVPYQVDDLTPVRLIVFHDGQPITEISHLSSIEILLSP